MKNSISPNVNERGGRRATISSPRPTLATMSAAVMNVITASRRSFHDERIAAARAIVDPHALGLEITLDCLHAILPAEARSLVAAEWHQKTHGTIGIDPHSTRLDAPRHRVRTLDRLRP